MSTRIRTLLALITLVSLLLTPALTASAAETGGIGSYDVKFAGVITTVPANTGDSWQIGGQTVKTDANTKIIVTEETAAAVGMWADVMAKKQTDGSLLALKLAVMPAEMRLIGPLEVMPEGNLGTWTVAGVNFTVNDETKISDRGDPIKVGGWVEISAVETKNTEGAATLTAVRIKSVELQEGIELYGVIEKFGDTGWTISGVPFAVNDKTRVMGAPKADLLAKASLKLQEDKTLLANTIKVMWEEKGGWREPVAFTGKIVALPEGGLIGVWTVDDKQVDVSEQTMIMQKRALAEVGATVHVLGWMDGSVVKAFLISVMAPPPTSKPFILLGVIEKLPDSGLIGTWTVTGNQIEVTSATRIAGQQYVKVGAPVTVIGTQNAEGKKTATLVHVKQMPW